MSSPNVFAGQGYATFEGTTVGAVPASTPAYKTGNPYGRDVPGVGVVLLTDGVTTLTVYNPWVCAIQDGASVTVALEALSGNCFFLRFPPPLPNPITCYPAFCCCPQRILANPSVPGLGGAGAYVPDFVLPKRLRAYIIPQIDFDCAATQPIAEEGGALGTYGWFVYRGGDEVAPGPELSWQNNQLTCRPVSYQGRFLMPNCADPSGPTCGVIAMALICFPVQGMYVPPASGEVPPPPGPQQWTTYPNSAHCNVWAWGAGGETELPHLGIFGDPGPGAGGGGFAYATVPTTPGATYVGQVGNGDGDPGIPGQWDSFFVEGGPVVARGGDSVLQNTVNTPGLGGGHGANGPNAGQITFDGGDGSPWVVPGLGGTGGGGGGAASLGGPGVTAGTIAVPSATGGAGGPTTVNAQYCVIPGGDGGTAGGAGSPPGIGSAPGGGAGGSKAPPQGETPGGAGQVLVFNGAFSMALTNEGTGQGCLTTSGGLTQIYYPPLYARCGPPDDGAFFSAVFFIGNTTYQYPTPQFEWPPTQNIGWTFACGEPLSAIGPRFKLVIYEDRSLM